MAYPHAVMRTIYFAHLKAAFLFENVSFENAAFII